MDIGINNYKDAAELISYIITSISFVGLWIAYVYSRKQIHFSTMEKCINDYRNWMKESDKSVDDVAHEYLDIVNEELFYFEKKYLPMEVSMEWIDGMIDCLPFFNKNNEFIPSESLKAFEDEMWTRKMMNYYPRIFKAISIKKDFNFENLHLDRENPENLKLRNLARKKLIFIIMQNLDVGLILKFKLLLKINNCR